ncbi:DUF7344 domain-containing protein [Halosimplex halobium]|uniref:DUF7344 domain-containing protein n=1 Tax=Halosimplex halobium TaxID=3396618 RepID=UPI003F569FBC
MMGASKVFGILSNDRRRRVLLLLCEEESVRVPDAVLTRGATARTAGDGEARSRLRRQAMVRLYHVDLPKLDAEDLVDWERGSEVVRRGPRFEEVEPVLDTLADNAARIPQEIF